MKNIILLMVMTCLLAGCAGKLKTEAEVTSEQGLQVKVMSQDEKPLPIKMVPDEIVIGAFIACLIAVVATCLAAIAAWRAAINSEKALKKIKKRSDG